MDSFFDSNSILVECQLDSRHHVGSSSAIPTGLSPRIRLSLNKACQAKIPQAKIPQAKVTLGRPRRQSRPRSFRALVSLFMILIGLQLTTAEAQADLFVSAAGRNAVERYDRTTGAFLGDFVAPNTGGLGDPQGIAFGPDGHLYVASNGSNNVLRFDGQSGELIDVFATTAGMSWPAEINFRNGHLYVSDFSGGALGRVSRFDATTGAFVDHFITGASLADGTSWDAAGDLYVSNFGTNSIRKYDGTSGALIGDFVTPRLGGLNGPLDNLFLPDGSLLVSSFITGDIKHYASDGTFLGTAITGLVGGAQGLELGPDGTLYAGDFGLGRINRYDANTFEFLGTFVDSNSTTNNFVFRPSAVPEPTAAGVLFFGGLLYLGRRKRRAIHEYKVDSTGANPN